MHPVRAEFVALWRLGFPVAAVQLGIMLLGVVDIMMVGRFDDVHQAAAYVGHSVAFTTLGAGMGVVLCLDPVIAQAFGARDEVGIAAGLQRGIVLALALSVPVILLMLPATAVLEFFDQDPDVIPIAVDYIYAQIPGVPFFLLFVALRSVLQSMHVLRPIVITIVAANLANVVLNYALIFGELPVIGSLGFEGMGAVGSGYATSAVRIVTTFALFALGAEILRPRLRPWLPESLAWKPFLGMLKIGAPIGLQVAIEVGAFSLMTLMVGSLGATAVAGSGIALNLASISFMIPLGISTAAAVRVGNAIGRGDPDGMRRSVWVALVSGVSFMSLAALCYLLFPEPLARLYNPGSDAVVAVAVSVMPLVALFQVFDGTQAVATGTLRGAADTFVPVLLHALAWWGVAMPLAWYFGLSNGREDVRGIWWGLAIGIMLLAPILILRVRSRFKRAIERLDLESPNVSPEIAEASPE